MAKIEIAENLLAKNCTLYCSSYLAIIIGSFPVSFHFRIKRFAEELASGGFNETRWQPEKRRQRHQESSLVFIYRLDFDLPEIGIGCIYVQYCVVYSEH